MYLFVVFFYFGLSVMARTRAWLPLALLEGPLLFLRAVMSNMSGFIAAEANYFPDIVLHPLWVSYCLTPPIASQHEVLSFCHSCACSPRWGIHGLVFWCSKRCLSSLLIAPWHLECFETLFEPFLVPFQMYEPFLLFNSSNPLLFVCDKRWLYVVRESCCEYVKHQLVIDGQSCLTYQGFKMTDIVIYLFSCYIQVERFTWLELSDCD